MTLAWPLSAVTRGGVALACCGAALCSLMPAAQLLEVVAGDGDIPISTCLKPSTQRPSHQQHSSVQSRSRVVEASGVLGRGGWGDGSHSSGAHQYGDRGDSEAEATIENGSAGFKGAARITGNGQPVSPPAVPVPGVSGWLWGYCMDICGGSVNVSTCSSIGE